MDRGIVQAGGSDCPVEHFNPWEGMYAAATRKDLSGYPPEGWHPHEKVSVYDALCMFSKNVAIVGCNDDVLGTLETGKFADMMVTDRDFLNLPAEDLLNVKVLKTYLAGEEVYSA